VEEPVVSEGKSMPEGKSIGMESPGMEHSETSEVAGMSDSGTTKTTHATKSAVSGMTKATHMTKSAVAAASTHPGGCVKRRTSDDSRCRGQRDHHLAHHDASSLLLQETRTLGRNAASRIRVGFSGHRGRERRSRRPRASFEIAINNQTEILK
jgi:hypothetical protein